jgi:hypothetical protein
MGKSLKVHQTNGTDNVDQSLSARDRKQLARLGKLWKSDAERGLKTRHLMGKVLNEQVGPPAKRKAHGRRVLELYGAELGIAPSDLNRMGWFSHLFPAFSDFRTQHPEIDSWTRFKTALPSLRPAKGGKARQPVENPSNPALGGVARSFANLTSKLNGLDIRPVGAERQKLVDALRELAGAASRRLKIRVEVAVGGKERKPVVSKRSSLAARA